MECVKKQADRIKDWRERQKAEGRTSITVVLSPDARAILADQKEKSGQTYSAVVEQALQALQKQSYRVSGVTPSRRENIRTHRPARHDPFPDHAAKQPERAGEPKILIDDLANYPTLKDIEMEQALKKESGLHDFSARKGLFNRLFSFSNGPMARKKKRFQ